MARRASTRNSTVQDSPAVTFAPAVQQHITLPEKLVQLRSHWKWAVFSQFFHTFSHVFAMPDVTINDIEHELVYSESSAVLPRIMRRLLVVLTQDRKLTPETWQTALRKQYLRRKPEANPIGLEPVPKYADNRRSTSVIVSEQISDDVQNGSTDLANEQAVDTEMSNGDQPKPETNGDKDSPMSQDDDEDPVEEIEEPKDWCTLDMLTKLDSMHLLTEWQFQNPMRFRTAMRNDDEFAEWRIEPIGYDSKQNAYWFIGTDRLWIQRPLPRPKNLKRKRPAAKPAKGKGKQQATKRTRVQPAAAEKITGRGRAAKIQANKKLDAQAKELAELNRLTSTSGVRSSPRGKAAAAPRPLGTRLSARFRGTDDGWQQLPDEWLSKPSGSSVNNVKQSKASKVTALKDDSDSELTDLSEDEDSIDQKEEEPESEPEEEPEEEQIPESVPADFLEWETIAVTLYEWEHVADCFANATHYAEKALYKVLTNEIAPSVISTLREIIRQQQLEAAIVHRKRSSRIALREGEKEEARLAAMKRVEDTNQMSRARRLELRQQKEEAEREKREMTREQRMKEREAKEKEKLQEEEFEEAKEKRTSTPLAAMMPPDLPVAPHTQYHSNGYATTSSGSGSRTPASDEWELDCEICNRRGFNLDDDVPLMCCGQCAKWQHIRCHDRADAQAGRPKRNWNVVEFYCLRCRQAAAERAKNYPPPPVNSTYPPVHSNGSNGSHVHVGVAQHAANPGPASVGYQRMDPGFASTMPHHPVPGHAQYQRYTPYPQSLYQAPVPQVQGNVYGGMGATGSWQQPQLPTNHYAQYRS